MCFTSTAQGSEPRVLMLSTKLKLVTGSETEDVLLNKILIKRRDGRPHVIHFSRLHTLYP
jgi:hypothetical protein